MTKDERLLEGIEELGVPVAPGLDTSALTEYAVVSYTSNGALYGDDAPCLDFRVYELVYVAPISENRTAVRDQLRSLIMGIYGDWPSEENLSDASGQRYLYSFSSYGGVDDGAD